MEKIFFNLQQKQTKFEYTSAVCLTNELHQTIMRDIEKTREENSEEQIVNSNAEVNENISQQQTIEDAESEKVKAESLYADEVGIGTGLTNDGQKSTVENSTVEQLTIYNLPAGQAGSPLTTEEMEVHHHPKVEKKNFKEYFLEFLMIFLAVTMGFFAENLREHFADKTKEHEFIVSLKEDLVSDTTQFNFLLPVSDTFYEKLDSLYFLLQAAGKGEPYEIHRLYYMNFTYGFGL
jgi:hypothetical protein